MAVGCSLLAAAAAAYLAMVSWQARGTPWGCGGDSGCADVLRSRWSSLFGIPIGAFAAAAYLLLAGLLTRLNRQNPAHRHSFLRALAAAILVADLGFIAIQLFVLRAICPWCMASHAFGIAASLGALRLTRRTAPTAEAIQPAIIEPPLDEFDTRPRKAAEESLDVFESLPPVERSKPNDVRKEQTRDRSVGAVPMGIAAAIVLLAMLTLFGGHSSPLARLPQDANADTGPGPDRAIAVLQGRLRLLPHELPMIGSADAPKLMVILFDYACPHCRATHQALRPVIESKTAGLILLPTPLNSDCNPAIEETEPRFRDSCELARLALAVWRASPEQFAEFDAWLFAPELPRSAADARAEAVRRIGQAELSAALESDWIEERIREDVAAYQQSDAKVLPILLSPGAAAIVGRTDDERELLEVLSRDFKIDANE